MYKTMCFVLLLLFFFVKASVAQRTEVSDSFSFPQVHKLSQEENAFLSPPPVQIIEEKKVPHEKIESLRNEDAYWYANVEPVKKKEEQQTGTNLFNQGWFTDLLWILIIVSFIAVVIWYLASSNLQLFRKLPQNILEEEESEITEDIFMLNYEKEITKATETKNYRLAVRLWYLRTLKELSERGIIIYSHEKTNSQFLYSLAGSTYYRDFFRLTRNFEYTWYGQFPLSEEGYAMMQNEFTRFKSSLP